jgi:serine/threonine protein kinase
MICDLRTLRFEGCFVDDATAPRRADGRQPLPATLPDALFAPVTAILTRPTLTPPSGDHTTMMLEHDDDRTPSPHDAPSGIAPDPDSNGASVPNGHHGIDRSRLPALDTIIDKYRIEEELGHGGFAVVYRATHQLMRTPVAIKLLYPWVLDRHPHLADQLCEEARFTSLIDHRNVVRVHDVTTDARWTYIVMEYIDGMSFGQWCTRHPGDLVNVLKVAIHVCAGLSAALDQGLIHRDIKPGNILISRTGQAKLVDFGLARRETAQRPRDTESGMRRSGSSTGGTPAYIAPEQITDFDTADFRADIYSLGATLYHAVTGRPPFVGSDPLETLRAHLHDEPMDPRSLRPDLPPALATLLLRMLAKRPDDRPGSYDELTNELKRTYHRLRSGLDAPPDHPTTSILRRLATAFRREK